MIRSFIFFDLETTGLIGKNFMPKITEMSLVAVSRNDICNNINRLPRVLHKLVLPIHPNESLSKNIVSLTGLSNESLAEVQNFNSEAYDIIMNFINRQIAPVCFVAYNGNRFDYPIILSELQNIKKTFGEEILSIDMLHLMRDFFINKQIPEKNVIEIDTTISCSSDVSILLNDGCDEILCDALDSIMTLYYNEQNNADPSDQKNEETKFNCDSALATPQSSYCRKMQEINEKTPENQIIKPSCSAKNFQNIKRVPVRRKLNFTSSRPTNFKLSSVYKHILGTDPKNAHSAEGDCLSMIRCATQLTDFFIQWADEKAVPLNNHRQKL